MKSILYPLDLQHIVIYGCRLWRFRRKSTLFIPEVQKKKKKGYKSPLHNQMWRTFYHFVLGVDTQSYSRSSSLDSLKSLHLFFPLLLMMMFMEWSFSCQTGNWENLHHYPTSTGDSPHPLRELSPEGFLYFKYPYLQRMEPRWLTSQFYLGHGSHVEL